MHSPTTSLDAAEGQPATQGMLDPADNFWLIAACFFISGFAALLYETVWLRQFAILLGTSEQALAIVLAIVLASYMGGLDLGSRAVELIEFAGPCWSRGS